MSCTIYETKYRLRKTGFFFVSVSFSIFAIWNLGRRINYWAIPNIIIQETYLLVSVQISVNHDDQANLIDNLDNRLHVNAKLAMEMEQSEPACNSHVLDWQTGAFGFRCSLIGPAMHEMEQGLTGSKDLYEACSAINSPTNSFQRDSSSSFKLERKNTATNGTQTHGIWWTLKQEMSLVIQRLCHWKWITH